MHTITDRLQELGIELAEAPSPVANYVSYMISGNLVYISGQVSKLGDKLITGKLGKDISIEEAQIAARACGLSLLAQLKKACDGDLTKVNRCIKLTAFINAIPDFTDLPPISNGVSDLMVDVFGDAGRHARSTIGVATLPGGCAVEVEAIFELKNQFARI